MNTREVKETMAMLKMGLQMLFRSRANPGGDKYDNKFSSITKGHRRIMETFNVLEVEFPRRIRHPFDLIEDKYTRAVVAGILYQTLLDLYKTEAHRRILTDVNVRII